MSHYDYKYSFQLKWEIQLKSNLKTCILIGLIC